MEIKLPVRHNYFTPAAKPNTGVLFPSNPSTQPGSCHCQCGVSSGLQYPTPSPGPGAFETSLTSVCPQMFLCLHFVTAAVFLCHSLPGFLPVSGYPVSSLPLYSCCKPLRLEEIDGTQMLVTETAAEAPTWVSGNSADGNSAPETLFESCSDSVIHCVLEPCPWRVHQALPRPKGPGLSAGV